MELITGYEVLSWKMKIHITVLHPTERGGTVPKKQ